MKNKVHYGRFASGEQATFTMTKFDSNYQNSFHLCFLIYICKRAVHLNETKLTKRASIKTFWPQLLRNWITLSLDVSLSTI